MPGRFGPRFALEAVFLIALATAMGLADLSTTAIIVVMAVAWALVAIVEWLASREAASSAQAWRPAEYGWREERESVTEISPPADELETEDPLGLAVASAPRRRWFRRRPPEETSAER